MTYYIHSTLGDCYIQKYYLLKLVQSHPVFGVTLDTPTYIWFNTKELLLQGFKIISSVTYYGHDINV